MDTSKWKSLAVAIKSWQDVWAMKNLPEFKYLRPGTIISTLVDEKITELAKKEGISEDDWRKKYHKLEGAQTGKASSKKRKRRL